MSDNLSQTVEAVKRAMTEARIPAEFRADVIGYFCNAMNARAAVQAAQPEAAGEPVAQVADVYMSRYTIEWTNGPLPEGTNLYAAPVTLVEQGKPIKPSNAWAYPKDSYAMPVLFNPYTGEPRDARDVQSDPRGVLIAPPGKALPLAAEPETVGRPCKVGGGCVPTATSDCACRELAAPTPEPMSAPTAEPVAWQARCFYPEQGDTEWGNWAPIAMDNLHVWQRRVREMPGNYELRTLGVIGATPPSAATPEPSDAERWRAVRDAPDGSGIAVVIPGVDGYTVTLRSDEADHVVDCFIARATKGGKL